MKKIAFLTILFVNSMLFGQEKKIELQTITSTRTTKYTDGTTKTSAPSFTQKWRLEGDSVWNYTGRRYKDIAPYLNKYGSSAALLQQCKNLDLYGKGSGVVLMGAGIGMVFGGLFTAKQVETFDPNTGETYIEQKPRVGLSVAGVVTIFAGYYVRWGSIKLSMKKFEQSCEAYNKKVSNDTGSVGRLDFGLTGSNVSDYPMMNLKLSF